MKLLFPGIILTVMACFLAGCGQKNEEAPFIKVDESKVKEQGDHSGHIEMLEKTLALSLQVPDAGWTLKIAEVYVVGIELWAVVELDRPDGMAAQVISTVEDSVKVKTPDLPVTYYLIGAPSGLNDSLPANVKILPDKSSIAEGLAQGRRIYPAS